MSNATIPTHYTTHCAGCGAELLPGEGKSEYVEEIGATRRWDDRCHAANVRYLNMTLASEEVRFGKRERQTHREWLPWEHVTDDDYDPFFEGVTEYEFLGDVGDK